MAMEINKVKIHEKIILDMHQLYIDKNHDYGDSFEKVRCKYPKAIMVRLLDKMHRLEVLLDNEARVKGENIDDTLIDLANYCILELVERKVELEYLKMYTSKPQSSVYDMQECGVTVE